MLRDNLLIRAFLTFILLPGIFALILPLLIDLIDPWDNPFFLPGNIVIVIGLVLLLWCVRDFYVAGKGTLAPWDPPKNIVTIGLYRFVRNPMYGSILFLVLGWGIFFRSPMIFLYDSILFFAFHAWVVKFEELQLKERFDKSWERYKKNVNRWFPRFTT